MGLDGNNALIWVDRSQEIVFKQFDDEVLFKREAGFLRRLAVLPWIPKVLGTASCDDIWGIFMRHEGPPVGGAWEEVEVFVGMCVRELHVRGVHHHDIAPRNILRRRDGSLVLIDFEQAVDVEDCKDRCPDDYPENEFV